MVFLFLRSFLRRSQFALLSLSIWLCAIGLPVHAANLGHAFPIRSINSPIAGALVPGVPLPVLLAQLDPQGKARQSPVIRSKTGIAIVYPRAEEPYRGYFVSMMQGIEDRLSQRVGSYEVDNTADLDMLNSEFHRSGVRLVIALGRQGADVASKLDKDFIVLEGGVVRLSDPGNINGISLTPDPALLFARLHILLPDVKRIIAVFDPSRSSWLIRLARAAARAQGFDLTTVEAHDLAEAASSYSQLFTKADGRRDAIWVLPDSTTAEEGTLLPLVLRESWNHGMAVFSSNMGHLKNGVLFSMSSDHRELGRSLANTAMRILSGDTSSKGIFPLRDVKIGINSRTAKHLGIAPNAFQQRDYDFIYPEP